MKQYVIALDQGTTSSRCILFDREQNIVGVAQREFTQIYPKPGWVEQDPMEIQPVLGAHRGVGPDRYCPHRGGRHWHYQPAGDYHRLGQSHRPPYLQRHRLAVPPYRISV